MPIYEYEALETESGCSTCGSPFEVIHGVGDDPVAKCPDCNGDVRRIISRCRAVIIEGSPEGAFVENRIKEHETQGRWSHAAELADKHAEKTHDRSLKARAQESYKKAGYDVD